MSLFLHTFHPSPVLVMLGPFYTRWYGFLLALGATCAFVISLSNARRAEISEDDVTNLGILSVFFGFLGARLYHVLNELPYYLSVPSEIFKVWHGGLAIHGGLLAGLLTFFIYCRRKRLSLWRMTDLVAPGLILAQAIGRWGNYFNQELFGRPTNLPWGIPIDPAYRPEIVINSAYFHPTFLYEFLWDTLVFIFLLTLYRKNTGPRPTLRFNAGIITMLYLGFYALGRFGTELLRIDRVPIIAGIRLPLLVSGLLVVVAATGLWYFTRHRDTRHSSFQP